jgi:hypothetical protein
MSDPTFTRWWLAALALAFLCGALSGWIVRHIAAERRERMLTGRRG